MKAVGHWLYSQTASGEKTRHEMNVPPDKSVWKQNRSHLDLLGRKKGLFGDGYYY